MACDILNEIVYSFLVMKEVFETNSILPQNTHVWGESYLGIIRKYIISFWRKFKEKEPKLGPLWKVCRCVVELCQEKE